MTDLQLTTLELTARKAGVLSATQVVELIAEVRRLKAVESPIIQPSWTWPALATNIVDGDTLDVNLDRGFSDWNMKRRLRLALANTAEMNDSDALKREKAKAAKEHVCNVILGNQVVIRSEQWRNSPTGVDSFGRYLMHVYYMKGDKQVYLNQELIDMGLAKVWTA